jgi:hypothetical protein
LFVLSGTRLLLFSPDSFFPQILIFIYPRHGQSMYSDAALGWAARRKMQFGSRLFDSYAVEMLS